MNDLLETINYKGCRINIYPDYEPDSPRDWCNAGVMVTWHPRYTLGDEQIRPDDLPAIPDEYPDLETYIRAEYGAVGPILPLYLFDHSGLSMSTSTAGFSLADSAGWDWGMVGVTFATEATLTETGVERTDEKIAAALTADVETYDQYLRGDVYGYVAVDPAGATIGACGGFYGGYDSDDGMIEEAKGEIDGWIAEQTDIVDRWLALGVPA